MNSSGRYIDHSGSPQAHAVSHYDSKMRVIGYASQSVETMSQGAEMKQELTEVKKLFKELMRTPAIVFPATGEKLVATASQGVYVILGPRNSAAHVGRTLRGKRGIAQRLNNHLHGQSSFTINHLSGDGSRLRGKYQYKYIEVPKARTRALLEAYATAQLCPKYLGLGEDVS